MSAYHPASTMTNKFLKVLQSSISTTANYMHTYLAQTPEIGQGLGRFLSCGARKQEQT